MNRPCVVPSFFMPCREIEKGNGSSQLSSHSSSWVLSLIVFRLAVVSSWGDESCIPWATEPSAPYWVRHCNQDREHRLTLVFCIDPGQMSVWEFYSGQSAGDSVCKTVCLELRLKVERMDEDYLASVLQCMEGLDFVPVFGVAGSSSLSGSFSSLGMAVSQWERHIIEFSNYLSTSCRLMLDMLVGLHASPIRVMTLLHFPTFRKVVRQLDRGYCSEYTFSNFRAKMIGRVLGWGGSLTCISPTSCSSVIRLLGSKDHA